MKFFKDGDGKSSCRKENPYSYYTLAKESGQQPFFLSRLENNITAGCLRMYQNSTFYMRTRFLTSILK